MSRQGQDNSVFTIESDPDRIEVVTTASSSHSDLNSTGSQSFLTSSQTNFRYTQPDSETREHEGQVRVPTPSNMVRRWSQNLSKIGKGKKTIREQTIYRLPSRKVFAVDGQLMSTNDVEIQHLANEIEQHDFLMQDNATGNQIRMETIRALPHPLTTKRQLKEKLSISVHQQSSSEPVSFVNATKNVTIHVSVKFATILKNAWKSIEIWYESMKEIEGHFGSSVGTYFKFLRWLYIMNAIILLLTFGFVMLPQVLYDNSLENRTNGSIATLEDEFSTLDVLTGDGYFKTSLLFYGAYTNETFSLRPPTFYSIPHAYFMTMLCIYMITFVVISTSMARSYRKSFIETSGGIRSMYAHKVFCSWDFGISNKKAAQLKHSMVVHELKEVLSELHESEEKIPMLWTFLIFCSQLTAHLLIGGMIAGLGTALWILLKHFGDQGDTSPWTRLYLPLAVNLSMMVFQAFFAWIAKLEDYRSPRKTLHVTLMRNFALEAVVIGVLVYFWLTKNYKGCWETSIGQEIYRIIMADFVINMVLLPLFQVFQYFVLSRFWPSMKKSTFDISQKSLGLVFNQTLLWMGLLFSPLLAAVITIKMLLLFYIKKLTLIYLSKSPTQLWRSAQTQTLYLVFTFLSLLGVIITLGYIMTQVPVSPRCGPFRNCDYMFQIFIDSVLKLRENHWIWRAIMTITRPAVLGGILLTMLVIVYYLRSKSKARSAMVKLLKEMLYLEAKDKEFLLMNITKVTQDREWLFEDLCNNETHQNESDRFAESSSTWRFQRRNPSSNSLRDDEKNYLRSRHI